MASLTIRNLSFSYPPAEENAATPQLVLCDVSMTIPDGAFVVFCGESGSGKSTLLRQLKREIAPLGERSGTILIDGRPLAELSDRDSACRIGYVGQQPEEQIVTDRVYHELAFGLENLGLAQDTIRRRVAETACLFGIEDWFDRDTASLSGGQKQLLSLAAVMTMDPDVLLLDEPTAQLDPIAAVEFLSVVERLHREYSVTVLLVEHHLENALPCADFLACLSHGRLLAYDTVPAVLDKLRHHPDFLAGMPAAVRLFAAYPAPCPVTIRDGKAYLRAHFANDIRMLPEPEMPSQTAEPVLSFRDVWFRYGRTMPDVLRGLSFTVYTGEIFCVLGGNGSGKSTMLSVASGWQKPYSGEIRVFGKRLRDYTGDSLFRNCLAYLPQDVTTLFACNTVERELSDVGETVPESLAAVRGNHPYDLSGGQRQMLALTKVLASGPRLLLLDEPTRGLDPAACTRFGQRLHALRDGGLTIVCVTHDVEFAAAIADRCAFFFRGEITSIAAPHRFFAENHLYTTAVSRITRGYYDNAVTVTDTETLCTANGYREDMV